MIRRLNIIIIVYLLFIVTACSIVDNKARPNTKKYLISDIDTKLSDSYKNKVSYIEKSYNNEMDEDLSNYVAIDSNKI